MVKVALLCYHKNLTELYPSSWIDDYRNSILLQTVKGFTIYEVNYGGGSERIFSNSIYESIEMPTFVHALNYLLDKAFLEGADCVFNSNADDIFHSEWIELQAPWIISGQYDLVSSNFSLKYEKPIIKPPKYHYFDKMDLKKELQKDHNIIGHPGVCYSPLFWEYNRYIPDQIPVEDLELWKRSIDKFKFKILPEHLFIHRVHENAVCRSDNK